MKKSRIFAAFALLAAATVFSPAPARAQISSTPPMVVKQTSPKPVWMKAVVVHADAHSMVVREEDNERMLHTFTYSEKVAEHMAKILDGGENFQMGDKVEILHLPDKLEAIRIKGSPSKPH